MHVNARVRNLCKLAGGTLSLLIPHQSLMSRKHIFPHPALIFSPHPAHRKHSQAFAAPNQVYLFASVLMRAVLPRPCAGLSSQTTKCQVSTWLAAWSQGEHCPRWHSPLSAYVCLRKGPGLCTNWICLRAYPLGEQVHTLTGPGKVARTHLLSQTTRGPFDTAHTHIIIIHTRRMGCLPLVAPCACHDKLLACSLGCSPLCAECVTRASILCDPRVHFGCHGASACCHRSQ